jgi:NSS family neurotransmitter:Na+ symporter
MYAGGVRPDDYAGVALVFEAIPLAFDHLAWGRVYLAAFFLMLVLAAWLYALALFEPVTMWAVERFEWRRMTAAIVCGIGAWALGIVFLLSFSTWKFPFDFFGESRNMGLVDIAQLLTSHLLFPAVGIGTALFAGWVFKVDLAREQLKLRSPCSFDAWLWLTRVVVPFVLVCIMWQISKTYA